MIDIIVYLIIAGACAWLIFRAIAHFRHGGCASCSCSTPEQDASHDADHKHSCDKNHPPA